MKKNKTAAGHSLPVAARALAVSAALCCAGAAHAAWSYSVDILGVTPKTENLIDPLESNLRAALDLWTRHLDGGAAIEVEIELSDKAVRASGYSVSSGYVRRQDGYYVFEQGLAFEIRTGIDATVDPTQSPADLRIEINNDYLVNELWFDPEPARRGESVPAGRTDAVSLLAHELGHALAFNGWWVTEQSAQELIYGSTWDLNTRYVGTSLYFTGPAAMALYGGPVPVTDGNNWHVGNAFGAGSDQLLLSDLMTGVALYRGSRYDVTALDLAMLSDMGVAVVPEPQTWLLLAAGLAGLAGLSRKRRQQGGRVESPDSKAPA